MSCVTKSRVLIYKFDIVMPTPSVSQSTILKQEQRLSPQQIQLMKLIQLPITDLEQRIKEEIEANPALEEDPSNDQNEREEDNMLDGDDNGDEFDEYNDGYGEEEERYNKDDEFDIHDYIPDDDDGDYNYKILGSNYSQDDDQYETPIVSEQSFQEYLMQQIGYQDITDEQMLIGNYIIGSLDDNGYLARPIASIVDDLLFTSNVETTEQEVEEVLKIVQQLDPPGIGATNLQECLMIQLKRLQEEHPFEDYSLAMRVVDECFEAFSKKHYDKIARKLNVSNMALKAAIDEIQKLNPKPGDTFNSNTRVQYITPDFYINVKDGELDLSLAGQNMPELHINKEYPQMLEEYSGKKESSRNQETVLFIKKKIDAAKWFINAIDQRQNTLRITMQAIMDTQKDYFLSGDDAKLKPMILKDIAQKVGLDISTVSRVANSKYVQTPYGTFLLKKFFSEGITNNDGEEVSTREIKKVLREHIDAEDKSKPLTDEELRDILEKKGYPIARRTVAKYREQLDIPVARLRKEIK